MQGDREAVDISKIMRDLHQIVDEAIDTQKTESKEKSTIYDISKINFDRLRQEFKASKTKRTAVQCMKSAIENRLRKLLQQNPLRTDFQKHYEEIVAEYNQEKDRVTIEKTFEALLILVSELTDEEKRAVQEGLDEETLALYDLLAKPNLSKKEIDRLKKVATTLLATLKDKKLSIANWREKESSRDAVRQNIYDFLFDEQSGLPVDSYGDDEVEVLSESIFSHIYRAYPVVPSPCYSNIAMES